MITKEQNEKYIEDGNHCPQCDSEKITSEEFEFLTATTVFREVRCKECKAKWEENFAITDITDQEIIQDEGVQT